MRTAALAIAAAASVLLSAAPDKALADRPMAIDEAGVLERGETKLDIGVERIDDARGPFAALAHGLVAGLEADLQLQRMRDRGTVPADAIDVAGVALKWVPLSSEQGLSAGVKAGYAEEHGERNGESRLHTLELLLHWETRSGLRAIANLGRASLHSAGSRETFGTWGFGFDVPVGRAFHLTVESFGAEGSGPDRQLGLRYRLAPNLALWLAGGRGNDANFASLGITCVF